MANTLYSQVLNDGPKTATIHFTAILDGVGEENKVVKVDASTLSGAPTKLKIMQIWYSTSGVAAELYYDADTDPLIWVLENGQCGHEDFRCFGGLNADDAGLTGDILLSTVGATAGDSYSVVLEVSKS